MTRRTSAAGHRGITYAGIVLGVFLFAVPGIWGPCEARGASFPLTLSLQGMGVVGVSGQGTINGQNTSFTGEGWGAGLLGTLHFSEDWALRAQGDYIQLTGTPVAGLVPMTLGLQYTVLRIFDLASLYILGDAGYNFGQSYGNTGNSFVWDAGVGLNVGILYAEVRYEEVAGPIVTSPNTSLGSTSFFPIVVGITFF